MPSMMTSALILLALIVTCSDLPLAQAQTSSFATGDSGQTYFTFNIDQDMLHGAPDRSDMNQPLTPADRIFVRNGHFYRVGKDLKPGTTDDQRVRLYGVNLTFSTNFPSKTEAVQLAKRLRKLGFNAVRLHHMDSNPGTATNPPNSVLLPAPYPTFSQEALTRLRDFVRVLANEGIYTNINLYVNYPFSASVDGIPPFENNNDKKAYGSAVHMYAPRLIELQERYTRQLLKTLDLRDFYGLAMVEISNEASLLAAWQRGKWQMTVPQNYEADLQHLWQSWVIAKYGSTDKACKFWGECMVIDKTLALLSPNDTATVSFVDEWKERINNKIRTLSNNTVNATDPGIPQDSTYFKRLYDFLQFLADTDRRYFNRMRTLIHQETNALVPVTGTQMMYGGVMNFDSHAAMDYIDEHFYLDHPEYPGTSWDLYDWRIRDSGLSMESLRRLFANAYRRDSKKPFVISEFNYPYPNRQSTLIQPLMAAVAAMQDWDGLFYYDYADGRTWGNAPSAFSLTGDWGKFSLTGQSALLFRQQLQPTLQQNITIPLSSQTRQAIEASRDFYNAFDKHVLARYGISPEQAIQARIGMDITGTAARPQHRGTSAVPWQSPDLSFTFDENNILRIQTPQAIGVFGVLPAKKYTVAPGFTVTFTGKGRRFVSLLITALDGMPVSQSQRILLTLTGATTGSQPGSLPVRPKEVVPYKGQSGWWTLEPDALTQNRPSGSRKSSAPVWIERTEVTLTLPPVMADITVYPLDQAGQRLDAVEMQKKPSDNSVPSLRLQASEKQTSLWYEIIRNKH